MGSLILRVHVAIVAFAVGTAASLIWNTLERPHVFRVRTRHAATARPPVESLRAAATGTNVPGCSVGAEAVEAAFRDNVAADQPFCAVGGPAGGNAKPQPAYPPAAVRARISGAVSVRIVADESGRVVAAHAVSGHPLLRAPAVAAACRSRFSPTMRWGRPVAAEGVLTYNFVLD
ncbi:MAG TPA: energy transducer TonB [Pyrinomonadaceae bacterium]|nr:energy transducer TonB [Pyrinomonadaceae bacterium]